MQEFFSSIWAMKQDIINIICYVIAAATVIVKLTPTQKDDAVLGKIVAFLSKYIALNPTNPK